MPSPNIIAACLAQRTKRVKILILGNALPLYDHPLRVAEELAMLDVISGGRIIAGMVGGLGVEAYTYEGNPTFIRERYRRAHDLNVEAWTRPGPSPLGGHALRLALRGGRPRPPPPPPPADLDSGLGEHRDDPLGRRAPLPLHRAPILAIPGDAGALRAPPGARRIEARLRGAV